MEDLIISGTTKTPTITFQAQKGILEIRGTSIPENPLGFYNPVLTWVEKYAENPKPTVLNVDMEYFNTSSSKLLLTVFKALSKVQVAGSSLIVNWYYEEDDEEALESGHDFSMFAKVEFNFIPR